MASAANASVPERLRVLFVVPYVPSLVRVRPYNLIRGLTELGHQVTVATLWSNGAERDDAERLRAYCDDVISLPLPSWRSRLNCLSAMAGSDPLQARYSWSPSLFTRISSAASESDVVHVEHLRGALYGLGLRASRPTTPVVWDSVDCISDLFLKASKRRKDLLGRVINRAELPRTRRFEGRLVSRFHRTLVTSEVDGRSLLKLSGTNGNDGTVSVLTNGVDLDYFTVPDQPRQADTLVFTGKMSYHANEAAVVDFVRNTMPVVWARRPEVRLQIVGKDPSRSLRSTLDRFRSRVEVVGTVPDMRPYLQQAAVAVVPLVYGAGCQNKVLEAMACGTPVVATPPAVSSLRARAGHDLLVARGHVDFALKLTRLLSDERMRDHMGRAGRQYVENRHRWSETARQLEWIYRHVLETERQVA